MKAVVFAGGRGSRLSHLTGGFNKHLLPLGSDTVLGRGLEVLRRCGTTNVLILTDQRWAGAFRQVLRACPRGPGVRLSVSASADPGLGLAEVLLLAKRFVGQDPFLLLLGDNVFPFSVADFITRSLLRGQLNTVVLSRALQPNQHGVPDVRSGRIVAVSEKPPHPASDLVVTGLAWYSAEVFAVAQEVTSHLGCPWDLTAIHNVLVQRGELHHRTWRGRWFDIGTEVSYRHALCAFSPPGGRIPARMLKVLRRHGLNDHILSIVSAECGHG